jgi:DNA polymerase-1
MLAHAVLEPEQKHTLDALAESQLNYSPIRFSTLFPEMTAGAELDYSQVDSDQLMAYAVEDADLTWQLWQQLKTQLKTSGQAAIFYEIEAPLVPVLMQMEQHGISLDEAAIADSRQRLGNKIESLEAAIFEQAQQSFNLNSPKQLGHILFDELKLIEKPKKTKTGQYQTNEQVLTQLAPKHRIVADILKFRQLSKLKSTYVDALPKAIEPKTNRIHTHYLQLQTSTGRLASNQPNLQNIPIRTMEGQAIRKAFVPATGWTLLAADYSQIELRILAALSQDAGLLNAFKNNEDIHASTAAKIFDVAINDVSREQRSTAKMVNFGIPYGISAYGLSQRLGTIGRQEAQVIIDHYFAQFPGIPAYMQSVISQAREKGYVETLSGRRRFLRDIDSRNATIRAAAERNAINMPIQGTAADMIKLAMTRIHISLQTQQLASRLLLQVHDELVLEVKPEEMPEVRKLVREAMLEALPIDCPLAISLGQGDNWLAAH